MNSLRGKVGMLQQIENRNVNLGTLSAGVRRGIPRELFVALAKTEDMRVPIGIDLAIHAQPEPEKILTNGELLGQVMIDTARRYNAPFAFSRMDLDIEKDTLLEILGIPEGEREGFQFKEAPGREMLKRLEEGLREHVNERLQVQLDALRYVREHSDLIPVGSVIGPFTGATKLLPDPITPVFLYGHTENPIREGDDTDGSFGVAALLRSHAMMQKVIERSITLQLEAGAGAVLVAEPAAHKAFISPKQIAAGSPVFDELVVEPNLAIREQLEKAGAMLFFHSCGEIDDQMLAGFVKIHPELLSLGSSRVLWEDAAKVPDDIVLYGNIPSKKFFQQSEITVDQVKEMGCRLVSEMRKTGHPFILGSECDVLSVPGAEKEIAAKVAAFVHCECNPGANGERGAGALPSGCR